MAPHSSTLAWKIPWTEGSGGLQSMGSLGVGHDWAFDFTFTFHFHALEKEMATHSSVLAWRIPGTGEPGGLLSMRSHWVGHDWSDLAAAAMLVRLHFSSWARSLWGHRSPLTLGMGFCFLGTAYTSGPWSFPLSSLFPRDKCSKGDLPFLLSFFLILG